MVAVFTAADATRMQSSHVESTQRHFDVVLKQCYARLRYISGMNLNECKFDVPEYIIGFPPFVQNELVSYILETLRANQYTVTYELPRFLTISWPRVKSLTSFGHITEYANASRCISKVIKNKNKDNRKPPGGFIPDTNFELILP